MVMKAAILLGPRDIRTEMVESPPIREDEVLVKVMACGICGTDVHAYKRGHGAREQGRFILGHEFSGEIEAIGAAVMGLAIGDRVVGTGYRNCGSCYQCQHGQPDLCPQPLVPGEGLDGAFAEYVVVPRPLIGKTFFRIPAGLSWEEAATIEPLAVACHAAARARIQSQDTVVILGAGMIGQCIAQVCRSMGARTIVVEPSPIRLALAEKLGAEMVLNPRDADLVKAVAAATSGGMASTVFECSGSPEAFRQAVAIARPFGRIVQVGLFERSLEIAPELASTMFAYKNLTLRGSGGQRWDMAMELVSSRRVSTGGLITHRFPLDRVEEAFETQMDAKQSVKVMVIPGV
ncbi:MAG: alcohol dehydrogenase catalytic domain-containing protein [Dehalococcoidia bacterium]|nr:alcohol dehydrogenase catalytic domain-containing protein [Dehalococcoidia bacterium]